MYRKKLQELYKELDTLSLDLLIVFATLAFSFPLYICVYIFFSESLKL